MKKIRELLPAGGVRRAPALNELGSASPSFDYPATQVGVAGNITVYYDSSLGAQGLSLAEDLLGRVANPYSDMQTFFGIPGGTVSVVIAALSGRNDGSGGAYHYGCDFTSGGVLYLDATFSNGSTNPLDLAVGLYVAELSECFMGAQGVGWGCGFSNGEGLSRFCSEQATPAGTMDGFVTGPAWAHAGFPDWIDNTESTDRSPISTGCAIVYIYWMCSQGFTIPRIVQAGGSTLSANYQALTGRGTARQDLANALNGLSVESDNPFSLLGMMQGTSPSYGNAPDEPWQAAFQANTGSLWVVGTQDNRGDMGLGMMPGTNPSLVAVPAFIGPAWWQVAFQANTGSLWVVGTQDNRGDMGLGMMPGTSPSIIATSNDSWQVAFQANTGSLWVVGKDNRGDMGLGMMPGTSPSVIATSEGGWQVAFQANTGNLWIIGTQDNRGDTGLGMMQGTSPSLLELEGGWQVAFQANTGSLWVVGTQDNPGDMGLGMMAGTSPSIIGIGASGWQVAFQANTGNLWVVGTQNSQRDMGVAMMPGTSPSLGYLEVAFQAYNGGLVIRREA